MHRMTPQQRETVFRDLYSVIEKYWSQQEARVKWLRAPFSQAEACKAAAEKAGSKTAAMIRSALPQCQPSELFAVSHGCTNAIGSSDGGLSNDAVPNNGTSRSVGQDITRASQHPSSIPEKSPGVADIPRSSTDLAHLPKTTVRRSATLPVNSRLAQACARHRASSTRPGRVRRGRH